MNLNERQRIMLSSIAQSPRTKQSFTHGDAPCAPNVVSVYLDAMEEGGLIEIYGDLYGDLYGITEEGRALLNAPRNITPSRILTNACSTEPLVLPKWNVRAGSEQFLAIRSRGNSV